MSPEGARLAPPEKLSPKHDLTHFQCGEPALDDWLRRRAPKNEESGASRTYVLCAGNRVVGYYALAVGAVAHADAPGRVRRNMPDPVPVMIIGRLAIDQTMQGRSIRAGCAKHFLAVVRQLAEVLGVPVQDVRALLLDPVDLRGLPFLGSDGRSKWATPEFLPRDGTGILT